MSPTPSKKPDDPLIIPYLTSKKPNESTGLEVPATTLLPV